MDWLNALLHLRTEGIAGVLVTVTSTRGHTPRNAGAKMVVTAGDAWDSIGGGNLEATVIDRAREMLAAGTSEPQTMEMPLNFHATTRHGRQCCGGEAAVMLEPIEAPPVVAIFGIGHVGYELARTLSRLPLVLHLADSRAEHVEADRLEDLQGAAAQVHAHHAPAPEMVLRDLPAGAHVLIMTHDHSEDLILCDTALRRGDLGTVGVIGSNAKWSRFRTQLREGGHEDASIDTIDCPIGLPEVTGKSPAVIAISVAADLVQTLQRHHSTTSQEQS